jgi:hypothetical protein
MFESIPSLAHCMRAILRVQRRIANQAWNDHRAGTYAVLDRLALDCDTLLRTFGTSMERFAAELSAATSPTFAGRFVDGWFLEKIDRRSQRINMRSQP